MASVPAFEAIDSLNDSNSSGSSRRYIVHSKYADVDLIKQWLNECGMGHACSYLWQDMIHKTNHGPVGTDVHSFKQFAFIDVERQRLVKTCKNIRYFALSYCWGPGPHIPQCEQIWLLDNKTQSESQESELEDIAEILIPNIPRTILDAMNFTAALGEKYLWVDALCIPQDDHKKLMQQVEAMDVLYSNAYCTLIALEGQNSNAGLPGTRETPRNVTQISEQLSETGLSMAPAHEEYFSKIVKSSAWYHRGWTLQEGLLSPRKLIFSNQQMYFVCTEELRIEGQTGNISDFVDPCLRFNHISGSSQESSDPYPAFAFFIQYTVLVESYSLRFISDAHDALNAFKGILNVLRGLHSVLFYCGNPVSSTSSQVFGLALLWQEPWSLSSWLSSVPNRPYRPQGWEDLTWASWTWLARWTPVQYSIGEGDYLEQKVGEAVFSIYDDGTRTELYNWVEDQYEKSGRRGISHTKTGLHYLQIDALAVPIVDGGPSRQLRVDVFLHGMPMPDEMLKKELFLVATCHHHSYRWHGEQLMLLLVAVVDGWAYRIGTGEMTSKTFEENAVQRTFLMK